MPDVVQFRLVDAFADAPFTGNTAGVVLDADGLDESQMQLIAREVNASETAFICGADSLHQPARLRWFTPGQEVGFCGHATLAAAHAWAEAHGGEQLQVGSNAVVEFDSAAGLLRLHAEAIRDRGIYWWLRMPDAGLKPDNANPMKICEMLGMTIDDLDPQLPIVRTRDDDVILLIRSWSTLQSLRPRMDDLAAWSERTKIRGFCVSTLESVSDSIDVTTRFFAPAAGVPEDPVTGSVHGALAAHLVRQQRVPLIDGRAVIRCVQGRPGDRAGFLRAVVEQQADALRVTIGGACQMTIRGEMRVPPKGDG